MYTMYIFLRNKVIILKSLKKIYVLQNIKYHYPTDKILNIITLQSML